MTTAGMHTAPATVDPGRFRSVLSHYPTGVCVVTAVNAATPTGFVVGSFTSVSLDPALVGFFPDKKSTTFPKVRAAGAFCVNVLSGQDEQLCRIFATKGIDRFAAVDWHPGPTGSPVLERATAWIDCTLDRVHDVGDHLLVVGRVVALAHHPDHVAPEPLIFYKGRYGKYAAPARETSSA